MKHPETYTLSREEWLAVNSALATAALYASGCFRQPRPESLAKARKAREILSASYARAKEDVK